MQRLAVDLFAGVGGMSLGFHQAGFNVACAVEIEPVHARYHQLNFPNTEVITRDIKSISGDDIRRLSAIKNQEITVVFDGSPCQGYSNGLCPTLRAGTGSDKGNHTAPRPIHPFVPRVSRFVKLHAYTRSLIGFNSTRLVCAECVKLEILYLL